VVLSAPTNSPVSGAQLNLPSGSPLELTNLFGALFLNFDEYATQALLDAARPAGSYTLHVTRSAGGSQSLAIGHQAADWPPIPQIENLTALQNADAATDVTVQWNGFLGAGDADGIHLTIDSTNGLVFEAPDPCVPIELAKTATSIAVPKGILTAGQTYDATLTYSHIGPFDTNSIPDIVAFGSTSKSVSFQIVTGTGTPTPKPPTIGSLSLTGQGLQSQITGAAAGQLLQVQESTTLAPGSWTLLQTVSADASGNATFVFPVGAGGAKFYRLTTPP